MNEMNIESGTAMPTSVALRTPRKNRSTAMTKMRPLMMLFSRSLMSSSTNSLLSPVMTTCVPLGIGKASSFSWTASTVSRMLSPERFFTFRLMT